MRLPAAVVRGVVRGLVRPVLGPPVPLTVQRRAMELASLGSPLPQGTSISATTLGGRPAERVSVPGTPDDRAILLLHGGAFLTCSPRTHRVLAAHLSAAAGVAVHVLDYSLSPEHPWPIPVHEAVRAYDELAARGPVAVVGDPAGGCLALLLARERTPAAMALISPLVDLTRSHSDAWTGQDILIRTGWAKQGCEAFTGTADARALSPLHDDLTDLPPLLVHLSEHERLRPEGELLVQHARAAGVDVELVVLPGLWHDVHLFSHLLAEAADASAAMGRWLGQRLAG
ncbi:MAG: alpha/beta hydrolase fold domain-containing protein [Frankiales bacterium]|nr:alpha/beta hydrolase fold domain-containing protein [Frankiales bacterium]